MVCKTEDLEIYKYAYSLVKEVYRLTCTFPPEEKFGLISQMRRAAVSVCANMAEGGARIGKGEQKHFFGIARGSISELRLFIQLANDFEWINELKCKEILGSMNQIHAGLTTLINKE